MSDATTGSPVCAVQSLIPHLVCADAAAAIDFYKQAFGATEEMRLAAPNGKLVHGCVKIGNFPVMLVDEMPEHQVRGPKALGGTPVTIHLMVADVDAFVAHAVSAGATVVMPVADMFWGDRYGIIADPFGHNWSIATHQRDLTPEQLHEAMLQAPPC